ncbi:MAG: alpha/beta fold hydrolase [Pseudomonadota bacterium]|nr:alpha/beta fold hydrolase [Pseudomonadota bacterium]
MIEAWVGGAVAVSFGFTLLFCVAVQRRYPPVGHRVDVGPGRLHIVETAPRAPARGVVLLVHGASGNFADPHVALAERLADAGFRVFAVDRPGHGYSDRLGGRAAASPRRQAVWIRRGLESLGAREAIVVVHSLAGVLGLAMALEAPAFTRGLVLLAPVSHPWRTGVSWYYRVAATPGVGALFRWLIAPAAGLALTPSALRAVFAPHPTPPDYARRTRVALLFRPWHFRANAEDCVDLCAEAAALSPRYGEIVAPTAIVMGREDEVVSLDIHARACMRQIPGATLQLLPGVGHSPHFAAPETVVAAILDVAARARGVTQPCSEPA